MRIILTALLFFTVSVLKAQNQTAENIANKIAQRMQDTLQLADSVKSKIYQINMQLAEQKIAMRSQYTGTDSLTIKIQQVEKKRDSLYQIVLPNDKYYLYLTKKRNLVNNNN